MKAMKKVLFLTLVMALALTAVAFAGATAYDYSSDFTAEQALALANSTDTNRCPATYTRGEYNGRHDAGMHYAPDANGVYHRAESDATGAIVCTITATKTGFDDCTKQDVITYNCNICAKQGLTSQVWKGAAVAADAKHNWVSEDAGVLPTDKTPTCVTPGSTTDKVYCSNDGCEATRDNVTTELAAYGHDKLFNQILKNAGYDATKDIDTAIAASIESQVTWCNANYNLYTDEAEAWQAQYLKVEYTAPDRCKDGSIKVTCDFCKTVLFDKVVAAEVGHDWQLVANAIAVIPTCDTPGEIYVECSKCGTQEKKFIMALGHDVSGTVYARQNGEIVAIYDAEEDSFTDLPGKKFVECEVYQLVKICDNIEITLEELRIDLTDALEKALPNAVPQSITDIVVELLTKVDISVAKCDHIQYVNGGKIMPALWDHSYDLNNLSTVEFTKYGEYDGSCTEPSHFFLKCNGCEKWTTQVVGTVPGHHWKDVTTGTVKKAATCTENGIVEVGCDRYANCDGTKEIITDKLPHQTIIEHTGDCFTAGSLKETCTVCKTVVNETPVKAYHEGANNYRYDNTELKNGVVVLKDCTKNGTVTYDCSKCGTNNIVVNYTATGHFFNFDEKKDVNKDGKYDKSDLVIKGEDKATCNTFGYITLECQNGNCTVEKKFKNAEKLTHFDPKTTLSGNEIVPSTCTVAGKKIETCVCGKTRETALPLESHTPTKIDGKDVCLVCGEELKLEQHVKFNIQTSEMKVTSTGVSGRGVIDTDENFWSWTYELYARINYNFTLDNGETVAYVACVPVDEDGSFRAASPSCPYGATLTNVAIMITTDADAQDKLISNVTNMGITVIK